MPLLEDIKKTTEQLTGWHRPEPAQLDKLVRKAKANAYAFRHDGLIPNNLRWPVIVYRRAVRFPRDLDPAAVIEDIFARNGWRDGWRDGIYDYLHYHSRIHEVLGVARGSAQVRLGGDNGRTFKIAAGDVLVLPAGTGHQSLKVGENFLVVGAYPPNGHLRRMSAGPRRTCGRREACKEGRFAAQRSSLRCEGRTLQILEVGALAVRHLRRRRSCAAVGSRCEPTQSGGQSSFYRAPGMCTRSRNGS